MYSKKTSSQLKQIAKGIMLGKYRNAITLVLATNLILNTLSLMTITYSHTYIQQIIAFIISFILFLIETILKVGERSFYMNIACKQPYFFSDLFTGFKVHPDKTIITQLLIRLFSTLPLLPAIVLIIVSAFAPNLVITFLLACFLLIIGGGLSWWIGLRFSQVYYLLLDFPDYSSWELLKSSWKLMKGNAGRLLYLQVSFLPITFAGILSFGVGLLFVRPYQQMTYSLFYLDLIYSKQVSL